MSNELTREIIGAAIEVHRHIGPGLLEAIYEECLVSELQRKGLKLSNQHSLPLTYKGKQLNSVYRLDLLVENQVIVELKSVDNLSGLHKAQLLTYLKLARLRYGLLLNFNVPVMRKGIVRMLND
ncbi:hypothetical protein MPL1_11883 [Methylophaga lonarensis MPL]|uniref:GxxExxY protein n=1 Tax=Methylophaga lonarensis MPL TaxID=1286106 RepID=M7PE13_9GAMM|nr:GxxExxY protein [Methylophaga lonarensis]EMR12145.1 hypothetical protein MPL1_11883 [Methylophaga lonarensis MPL]